MAGRVNPADCAAVGKNLRPGDVDAHMDSAPPTLLEPRDVPLGGPRAMIVRRTLPHRQIRTVGAWCFVDHYGPDPTSMVVAPHPHIGLQTVSWLLTGEVEHRDSVGSLARVRPGELNIMTAGHGITHSEYSVSQGPLHGVQLWVALPAADRACAPGFAHHAELPGDDRVTVLVGQFNGLESPARVYSPLVGAQVSGRVDVAVEPDFEYAVLAVAGDAVVNGTRVPHAGLQYLGWGRDRLTIDAGVALVLGGEPLREDLVMWWNFVGRSHEEIVEARQEYESRTPRFGPVFGDERPFLPAPPMPNLRLKPRPGR